MRTNKLSIGIIDLKINNIFSIFKATQEANFKCKVINKKENYKKYDLIILPGVGSFKEAMKKIKSENIDKKYMNLLRIIQRNCLVFALECNFYLRRVQNLEIPEV